MELAVDGVLAEDRRDEELREPVECPLELVGLNLEEEVGVRRGRVGIGVAAVLREKLEVLVLDGVGLGREEEHVLAEVR